MRAWECSSNIKNQHYRGDIMVDGSEDWLGFLQYLRHPMARRRWTRRDTLDAIGWMLIVLVVVGLIIAYRIGLRGM